MGDFSGGDLIGLIPGESTPSVIAMDVLYRAPAGGNDTDLPMNTELYLYTTSGIRWHWRPTTNFTQIEVAAYTAAGSFIDGNNIAAGSLFDGLAHHVRLRIDQASGTTATYTLYVDGTSVSTDTFTTSTIVGHPYKPVISYYSDSIQAQVNPVHLGYFAVWSGTVPSVTDAVTASLGYPGETAGRRIERLCADAAVPFEARGDLDTPQAMGPQHSEPLMKLLEECVEADQGSLFEGRHDVDGVTTAPGLVYRTRYHQANQTPVVTLDFESGHVAPPLEPVDDDQSIRNDVTVKRRGGGEYRAEQLTGGLEGLAVFPYPNGIGRFETTITANLATDAQVPDLAHWVLGLGTTNEERYPKVRVDLAAPDVDAALVEDVLDVDVDDRLLVTSPQSLYLWSIDLHARGYTEVLRDAFGHSITFNCVPSSPHQTAELDNEFRSKLAPTTCQLAADVTTTATSWSVTIEPVATTTAGEYPVYVVCEGEEVRVDSVSGASSPQTFTVTRSINGVVKAHTSTTPIRLSVNSRARLAL